MTNKALITGFAALAMASSAMAQTVDQQKPLVLVEEFTNTSCSPCARFAPTLDTLIKKHLNQVVCIKYHNNYPSPTDQFYLAAKEDNDNRVSYYSVTGVPSIFFNGTKGVADKTKVANYFNYYIANATLKMGINATATLNDHKLHVETTIEPIADADGSDLRLMVAAVEEDVKFDKAVANGEKEFLCTVRKLIPGESGTQLDTELKAGQKYTYTADWTADNYIDENQMGIVCFVQNRSTKEVLATVYVPRPTGSDNAAKILSVEDTPDYICSPLYYGNVIIRNTGKNALTKANINVTVNGKTQTTAWTGSLPYLGVDTLQLETFKDFDFAPNNQSNTVSIWLSNLNGSTEQTVAYPLTFSNSIVAHNAVRLTLMTDRNPEDISWQLLNSAGDVLDKSEAYTESRTRYTHNFTLSANDCYTIEFRDAAGNGIKAGNGYYKLDEILADGTVKMIAQATYEGSVHLQNFNLKDAAGSDGIDATTAESAEPVSVTSLSGMRLQSISEAKGRPAIVKTRGGKVRKVLSK